MGYKGPDFLETPLMMLRFFPFLSILLCLLAAPVPKAWADVYSEATDLFRNTEAAAPFFQQSYGYAIFPTVGKGGFILAGGFGKGRVFVAGDPVGDTTLTQATIGLQIGGQAFTQIIFFEDQRAFREFTRGGFEFGGQVNATVIKASAQATASTAGSTAGANGGTDEVEASSPGYYKGMAVFIITTGGLMFEASVGGQRFSYRPIEQGLEAQTSE
jgi:lipid-binding SYLF domain-containing protein